MEYNARLREQCLCWMKKQSRSDPGPKLILRVSTTVSLAVLFIYTKKLYNELPAFEVVAVTVNKWMQVIAASENIGQFVELSGESGREQDATSVIGCNVQTLLGSEVRPLDARNY